MLRPPPPLLPVTSLLSPTVRDPSLHLCSAPLPPASSSSSPSRFPLRRQNEHKSPLLERGFIFGGLFFSPERRSLKASRGVAQLLPALHSLYEYLFPPQERFWKCG
ncbi:unnamed protein product [Victoria cruziana]